LKLKPRERGPDGSAAVVVVGAWDMPTEFMAARGACGRGRVCVRSEGSCSCGPLGPTVAQREISSTRMTTVITRRRETGTTVLERCGSREGVAAAGGEGETAVGVQYGVAQTVVRARRNIPQMN
jgi:hypothetical protein